jgi:hypothetical protein
VIPPGSRWEQARAGEARGWNPRIQTETARASAVMLASHVPGGKSPSPPSSRHCGPAT